MYTFKMDRPGLPPGAEVYINGLGQVRNGEEITVDDDAAEAFRHANSTQESQIVGEDNITVVTDVLGPTLLQAFKSDPTVTVEVLKPPKTPKPDNNESDNGGDN